MARMLVRSFFLWKLKPYRRELANIARQTPTGKSLSLSGCRRIGRRGDRDYRSIDTTNAVTTITTAVLQNGMKSTRMHATRFRVRRREDVQTWTPSQACRVNDPLNGQRPPITPSITRLETQPIAGKIRHGIQGRGLRSLFGPHSAASRA